MIKLVLVGVWACLVTLASTYAASAWKAGQEKAAAAEIHRQPAGDRGLNAVRP